MKCFVPIAVLLLPVVVSSGCSTLQHIGHPAIKATGDAAEVAVVTADGAIVVTATLTAKAKNGDVISVIVRDQDGTGPPVVLTVKVGA